jgi:hypothetical protein
MDASFLHTLLPFIIKEERSGEAIPGFEHDHRDCFAAALLATTGERRRM